MIPLLWHITKMRLFNDEKSLLDEYTQIQFYIAKTLFTLHNIQFQNLEGLQANKIQTFHLNRKNSKSQSRDLLFQSNQKKNICFKLITIFLTFVFIIILMKIYFLALLFLCMSMKVYQAQNFPHIIWTFWDNQQTMGSIQKFCLNKTKQLHKGTDWQIRFVTNKTLDKWLSIQQLEQITQLTKNNKMNMTAQGFSDLLRLTFLNKYGGVWMDLAMILVQNLNWLDSLQSNHDVIRMNGNVPDTFFFYVYGLNKHSKEYFNGTTIYPAPFLETCFIASKSNSEYIRDFSDWFKRLAKEGQKLFFDTRKQLLKLDIYKNADTIDEFINYFTVYRASQLALYKKYQAVKEAQKINPKMKHTNNYYKIWMMETIKGPFLHWMIYPTLMVNNHCLKLLKPLFKDMDQIQFYPKYMIKMIHICEKKALPIYLSNNTEQIQKKNLEYYESGYTFGQMFIPKRYECLYKLKIHQNSFLNRKVISSQYYSQFFKNTKVYSTEQLPWICSKVDIIDIFFYAKIISLMFFTICLIQLFFSLIYSKIVKKNTWTQYQLVMHSLNMLFSLIVFLTELCIMICQIILSCLGNFQSSKNISLIGMTLLFAIIYFFYFKLHKIQKKKYFYFFAIMNFICYIIQYLQLKKSLLWRSNFQQNNPVFQSDVSIIVHKIILIVYDKVLCSLICLTLYIAIRSLLERYCQKQKQKRQNQIMEDKEESLEIQSVSSIQQRNLFGEVKLN